MQDFIPKGTGNSRYLKSAVAANITHEELVALLRNGTFPVDLAGVNPAGVAQMGDALNKGNLLADETCGLLGLPTSAVPNDAFSSIADAMQTVPAYATDLYLYIAGRHPLLNAGPYRDYGDMYLSKREISLTGNSETITVYDAYEQARRN